MSSKMTRTARLWVVLGANLALVAALIGVGAAAHSLGVWAEGVDYLADAAAIGVALGAIRLEAPSARRPDGFPNATRYAALVNAGWLLLLTLAVVVGSLDRLVHGTREVHGLPVLIVSAVAAVTMAAGAVLLGGEVDADDDEGRALTMRAVLLDTAGDAAAAAGVAAVGGIVLATHGSYWLDPAVALVVSAAVAVSTLLLLRRIRAAWRR